MNSPRQATSPDTVAEPVPVPMPRRIWPSSTSSRSVSPGCTWRLKRTLSSPGEEGDLAAILLELEHRDRADLGDRLDDQDAGHHRVVGEMALEKRLADRHVLDPDGALSGLQLDDPIDEQERKTMRDDPLDIRRFENRLFGQTLLLLTAALGHGRHRGVGLQRHQLFPAGSDADHGDRGADLAFEERDVVVNRGGSSACARAPEMSCCQPAMTE